MTAGDRVTVTPAALHVEVVVSGVKIADSHHPVLVEETGLPIRYYLPRDDVRTDLLARTSQESTCPFKGRAAYWSVVLGDEVHDDLVWSYETPGPLAEGLAGLMCFDNDRVDLTIDGEREPRPSI